MAETAESDAASLREDEAEESVTALLEQLGREVSALMFYEGRLAAARHTPALRRAARDIVALVVVVFAFLTAFVLANAAAVSALSVSLADWVAALVLAAAWTAVGVVLALALRMRAKRSRGWEVRDAEAAREEAEQAVRATLERLAPAITREIAVAAVPLAGDMASGVVDAGEQIIESADEIVDNLTESLPGGGVVNQMWDVVLMPGRLGIRVATTVLKRGDSS